MSDTALRLADDRPSSINDDLYQWALDAEDELRRLHKVEEAYNAWHEKTEWVQDTSQPRELGMHRADILRQRLDSLHSQIADLGKALSLGISRINELEAELAEQARLVGMGSEREARLKAVNAELVEALREIKWSNDTTWQRDRAKAALAKVQGESK